MTTFALVHGSGDGGWAWHLVRRALRRRGHDAVAPDLPTDRPDATWEDCADAVTAALGAGGSPDLTHEVVVVGHSSGAFVSSLVSARLGAPQVLVAGMVPLPGESAQEWFDAVGWGEAVAAAAHADGGRTGSPDPGVVFFHDVPDDLARAALARERPTSDRLAEAPWPGDASAPAPTRYVVTAHDRFLPPTVQRHVARTRLGIEDPEAVPAGHCAHLSRPDELADLLAPPTPFRAARGRGTLLG